MSLWDILQQITAFRDVHAGLWPSRAYLSRDTIRQSRMPVGPTYVVAETGHIGSHTFGVADWFTDPSVPLNELRLES